MTWPTVLNVAGVKADHSGFSAAERDRGGGGASDDRPCSHAVVDQTEVLGLGGVRVNGSVLSH